MPIRIRGFASADTAAIVTLFCDTVHRVNGRDYSPEQVDAWAPNNPDIDSWRRRLKNKRTFVAEEDDQIVGFAELESNGYIDCLYCHADRIGRGIGSELLQRIEGSAKKAGLSCIVGDVSVTARPFFERNGFFVVRAQRVERGGVPILNYHMKKRLQPLLSSIWSALTLT